MPRDYTNATKYENQPEQIANRVARNRARQQALKAGTVRKGDNKEVDHIKPLISGGSKTDPKNQRVVSERTNTSAGGKLAHRK